MKTARKLIDYLGSAFDKDQDKNIGMRISYDGNMNWSIEDNVLTLIESGGSENPLVIVLSNYKLSRLSDLFTALTNYSVTYLNNDVRDLSGLIFIDGKGIQSDGNDVILYVHQNLLLTWFNAAAKILIAASIAIKEIPSELVIGTASTFWLNIWGKLFGVSRLEGESDNQYATQIIHESLELKCNNMIIEQVIQDQTGVLVQVLDIDWWHKPQLMSDLGFNNLAAGAAPVGGYPYWGLQANDNPVVCSFAVVFGVLDIGELDAITIVTVKNIVDKYKAAGTHGRYFAPSGDLLSTNKANENTNDIVFLVGPGLSEYTEVSLNINLQPIAGWSGLENCATE